MNTVRKSIVSALAILTISCVVFTPIANADDKANSANAENAVVVNQTVQTAAQEFFSKMSPEEFRDPVALDDFISRFPDSPESRAVFAIRFSLLEKFPTIEGYNDFIKKYPDKLQTQIAIQEVFKLYRNQNSVAGYYDFIQRYPNTEQALVATMYIQEIMFQYACQLDTEEEYDAFIEAFPDAPQVETARDKAKDKAIEKEKKNRENLEKQCAGKEDNEIKAFLAEEVRKMVNAWNMEINKFEGLYPKPETEIKQNERLKLYQIYRRAEVLQDVYKEVESTDNVQGTLQRFSISQRLKSIETAINEGNDNLIKKLDAVSDIISEEIGKIAKNQEDISKKLTDGFKELHKDLKEINSSLKEINSSIKETNKRLAKINDQFDAIANIIQIITRFPTPNPFPMLPVYFEREINYTNSFEPDDIAGIPFDFVEYRKQATSRSMKDIALSGYETIRRNLFENTGVGQKIEEMKDKWRSFTGNNTTIGKFLGKLVEKAVEFVPYLGPYIAPMAGEVTRYYVDDVFVPYVEKIAGDAKEKIELCKRIIEEYKERLLKWAVEFAKDHPELIDKINDIVTKFKIVGESVGELAKSFKELAIQVAKELLIGPEVVYYNIFYLN